MKHYGDITKIDGSKVPPVDIIVGGSPCQDLSTAGKREGLSGSRSGLFLEQIRIIEEMRNEFTKQLRVRGANVDIRHIKPRWMVWENVCGALSSSGGEDFYTVLEKTARVADKAAVIPRFKGKWHNSGCILGDGWSIAWRVHDAQFWGVPQRRKRVALVADFGGDTAPKILFDSESVSRNFEESGTPRKRPPETIKGGSNTTSYTLKIRGGVAIDSKGKKAGKGALIQTELSGTLGATQDQTLFKFDKPPLYTIGHDLRASQFTEDEKTDPLTATDYKDPIKLNIGSVVRRLTPLECERLQGYPDGWTDIGDWVDSKGKKHRDSDSPRYKAIGNSIALPFWEWMAHKMVNQIDPPATMASLFDGIGGFPLVFSRCGVDPVWASEVEEFPIAVTKKRFPE